MLQLKNLELQIYSMTLVIKTTMFLKEYDILKCILLYKDKQIRIFYTENFLCKGIP